MELHHSKHHQAYVSGLNAAEESYAKTSTTQQKIALQAALKFNGGGELYPLLSYPSLIFSVPGHINHSFFWKILAPTSSGGGKLPEGKLKTALEKGFGSVEAFKKEFNAKTAAIQGSGWGWLVCTRLEAMRRNLPGLYIL